MSKRVFISGVGRSGTTWISELINYKNDFKYIFEPFNPNRVKEAKKFKYNQYLDYKETNDVLFQKAKIILTGDFKNEWTDYYNRVEKSENILIKDIRTNLFLKWLYINFPEYKFILIIRHPCSVAFSWLRLNWNKEDSGNRKNLHTILNQTKLLKDFSEIINIIEKSKLNNEFEEIIFTWSILNYVTLKQFNKNELKVLYYENFITEPQKSINELLEYIGLKFENNILNKLKNPSKTSWNKDKFKSDQINSDILLNEWKNFISNYELKRYREITEYFNLYDLYKENTIPDLNFINNEFFN